MLGSPDTATAGPRRVPIRIVANDHGIVVPSIVPVPIITDHVAQFQLGGSLTFLPARRSVTSIGIPPAHRH